MVEVAQSCLLWDQGPEGEGADGPLAVFAGRPAPVARTLVDVLEATVLAHPQEPALDDGRSGLSYRELADEVESLRSRLAAGGIGVGDRVGVRVPSGTNDLYVCILAVLMAGAAYVPVDAEDPDERAELVFAEAAVCAVLGAGRRLTMTGGPTATSGPAAISDPATTTAPIGPAAPPTVRPGHARTTTPGSSSPLVPPAGPRVSPSHTVTRRPLSTPRRRSS